MSSTRRTTFAKLARERKLQERREHKRGKKRAAAGERNAKTEGEPAAEEGADDSGDAGES